MTKLDVALPKLRQPFTPAAVKWKIQTGPKNGGKALVVAYIDARHVSSRLNLVVPGEWSSGYTFIPQMHGAVLCNLTVCSQTRTNVGYGNPVDRDGKLSDNGIKTVYSDALKRAAVLFGIGEFLYALPQVRVPESALSQGKYLKDSTVKGLQDDYGKWLKSKANIFGEPFDHGDAINSQGDVEVDAPESDALLPDNPNPLAGK